MTRFVEVASFTSSHATSEIASIGEGRKRTSGLGYTHPATLKNGRSIMLTGETVERLLDPIAAIIPAAPGYSTIETGDCLSGEPWTRREPVIAWRITEGGDVQPITLRGPNDSNTFDVAVEKPSGDIWSPDDDMMFRSFDEFREAELRRAAERRARNAAHEEEA